MRNVNKLILVGGMSAIMSLTGCYMLNGHTGDRTAGRALDDRTITSTVEHDLNQQTVYKFSGVDVKTFDGVVQLSGFVDTQEQKNRAGDIAQHAEGVTQVVNNITLKPNDNNNNMAPTGRPNGYDNNYNNNNNNSAH